MTSARPAPRRWRIASSLLFGAAVLAGCAAGVGAARPTEADARWASDGRWPGTTLGDLEQGRTIFTSKCVGCHGLPRPDAKSADEWPLVVDEMAARSKLSAADRDLVLRYLSAESARLRSPGG